MEVTTIERFDTSSVLNRMFSGISAGISMSRNAFLENLLHTFAIWEDCGVDLSDSSLVGRWFNGAAPISPKIVEFYIQRGCNWLADDIEDFILPLFPDRFAVAESIRELLIQDSTVSEAKKKELLVDSSCESEDEEALFLAEAFLFAAQRPFVKRTMSKKQLKCAGNCSPVVVDFVLGGTAPAPCKWFCGRNEELESLSELLDAEGKAFLTGIPGIGKSEIAKAFAAAHKSDYTNILYLPCVGTLRDAITDLDMMDDRPDEENNKRFKRHDRFLKTLKEDTLLIFDNFNELEDDFLGDILQYRCQVLFTTRNRYPEEAELEVTEIKDNSVLYELFSIFYADADEETALSIIHAVHAHTFLVELAARLLRQGLMTPDELLTHLKEEGAGLTAEEYIIATKDKQRRKRTYREHIRCLFELYALFEPEQEFLRCLSLAPPTGVNERIFSRLMNRTSLNSVNALVEMGLLQRQEYHRILLHPLILEVVFADLKPSLRSCGALLVQVQFLMLHHGADLDNVPLLAAIVERTIELAEKDDMEFYLRFLEDCFTGLTDYPCRGTILLIQDTLRQLLEDSTLGNSRDRALFLENEAFLSKSKKRSLELHKEALEVLEIKDELSAQLASNIHSNMSLDYKRQEKIGAALYEIETAIEILQKYHLIEGHDSMVQLSSYAELCIHAGETARGIQILSQLSEYYRQNQRELCGDYAYIHEYLALAYSHLNDAERTIRHCSEAWRVYQQVWSDRTELLKMKHGSMVELCKTVMEKSNTNTPELLTKMLREYAETI